MNRRAMLTMSVAGSTGVILRWASRSEARATDRPDGVVKLVSIAEFSDAGVRREVKELPKITKTEGEWRRLLTPLAFEIARHESTERPFTGATWNTHDKGLYRCICCDTALFGSTELTHGRLPQRLGRHGQLCGRQRFREQRRQQRRGRLRSLMSERVPERHPAGLLLSHGLLLHVVGHARQRGDHLHGRREPRHLVLRLLQLTRAGRPRWGATAAEIP